MANVTKKFSRVVLGISGGVDSAVAALFLKKKGYEVIGVFMRNWDEKDEKGHCTGDADAEDAEWVCRKLEIPFHEVNFVKDYWNNVFMYLIEEYKAGFTPNPDIMCNKRVKFSTFLKYAQENHNAEAIATGHYARSSFGEDLENYDVKKGARLLQSFDRIKDQTFFLSQVPQKSLQQTIFPIGECSKNLVRKIADTANLHRVAEKRDSTGICFIGTRNFKEFISEYIENKPGNFIDLETQEVVGTHQGVHQWTVGQRCNLSPFPLPYYVCEKDVESNKIYVVSGTNHPALFTTVFFTEPVFWIHSPPPQLYSQGQLECHFRFQNTSPLMPCVITSDGTNPWHLSPTQNNMVVSLAEPLRAITPGQFAVFYLGEECLGSARILRPGPSSYALNVNNCRYVIQRKKLRCPSPNLTKVSSHENVNQKDD